MNRFQKHLLIAAAVAALCVLLAFGAFAVPAKPGTHEDGNTACRSHAGTLVTLDSLAAAPAASKGAKSPVKPLTAHSLPLLVLVVGFNNIDYSNVYDWSTSIFQGEKSLSAYYTDMSLGQFTFVPAAETSAFGENGNTNAADRVNDGVVHLTLDVPHEDWTLETDSKRLNRSLNQMITDAILGADAYVDFAAYDSDGDGVIENNELALGIIAAGYEASASYGYEEGQSYYLWAHAWTLTEAVSEMDASYTVPCPDGVQVADYIACAEQMDDDAGQTPISTLAHELGHYLGLPDLYDTEDDGGSWSKYDVGYLSLMASGSWGYDENGGHCPYSLDIWSRVELGWITPIEAAEAGSYTVHAQTYDAENELISALKIPTVRETEYYLLENRQFTKWDACLGKKNGKTVQNEHGGLILWHIDMAQYLLSEESNSVNNAGHRPAVMPLYPEKSNEVYSFIGKNTVVETSKGFFDRIRWLALSGDLGASLNLPLYGVAGKVNQRDARILSGILLSFDSESAAEMSVSIQGEEVKHLLYHVPQLIEDCTRGGVGEHWTCEVCGGWFADQEAQTPVTQEALAIAPSDHTWDEGTTLRSASVVSEGVTRYTCSVCGAVYDETIPRLPQSEGGGGFFESIRAFFERIFEFFRSLFRW